MTTGVAVPAALRRLRESPTALGVVAAVGMLLAVTAFPDRMPAGVYLTGVVYGVWAALVALAVVLVFTSNRLVNFAAFSFGGTAAFLFAENVQHHLLARLATGQFGENPALPGWALTVEWWAGAALAVGLAAGLAGLTYLLLVRRLGTASPLVGTVATVAVAVLLAAVDSLLLVQIFDNQEISASLAPPHDLTWHLPGAVLHLPQLLTLGFGALVLPAVELFLRRTRTGTAVRAAAANRERAATLGIDGSRVVLVVWLVAGALSGLAALLTGAATGPNGVGGTAAFVPVLAAVVLAATTNRWLAFVVAVSIGVLQQGLVWSFSKGDLLQPLLLAAVVGVLLLRRSGTASRVDVTDSSWEAAREVRPVPPELRAHPDVRRLRRNTAVVVALVALGFPFVAPSGDVATGAVVLVNLIVGLSLLVLTGWGGLISLGQFALAGVGGFVVAVLAGSHGLTALLALPLAALAGGVVAFLIGLPALRIRGLYLAIVTMAFAVATATLLLGPQYGGRLLPVDIDRPSLFGLGTDDDRAFYYVCLVVAAACVAAVAGLRRSRTARALIAARDNERSAQLFGVDLVRARLQSFVLSGVLAALAGGLFAYQQRSVDVGNFGPGVSLTVFLMVVVGGLGSLAGPALGAAFVGVLAMLPQSQLSSLGLPIATLAVLVAVPGGLTQLVFAARDALLRRIAVRHRIAVPSLFDRADTVFADRRARLAPLPEGEFVPERYALPHQPLTVPKVAATGKGA